MATMTYSNALLPLAGTDKAESHEAPKAGFFTRLLAAMIESRRRSAEREIARLEMVYGFKIRDNDTLSAKVDTADLPFNR